MSGPSVRRHGGKLPLLAGGNRFEVGARTEITSLTGQYGDERCLVFVEAAEGVCQRMGGCRIDGVAYLRPVDRYDGDAVTDLVANAQPSAP